MRLSELLSLKQGDALAAVGCGGKTSLINLLACENAHEGVLIAPTTRIALAERVPVPGVSYLGRVEGEKLIGLDEAQIREASEGYWLTLMEADGSKRLPLKGWAAWEPVIPAFATLTLGVLSTRALGLRATAETVHRLPEFLALSGLSEGDMVDECALQRMVLGPDGMLHKATPRCAMVINQEDAAEGRACARRIARALEGFGGCILIGSTHTGVFEEWRAA